MASNSLYWLTIACVLTPTLAYLDFGTITSAFNFEPQFTIDRPHQLPDDDVLMRYETHYASITAIAPAVRFLHNGTKETFWSMRYHHHNNPSPTRPDRGLFRRGVFSGDPPQPSCTPCGNGNNSTAAKNGTGATPTCSVTDYTGVFRSGDYLTSTTLGYCFSSGYAGPLQPGITAINTGIPCCPVCYPWGVNTTGTFTTGVFSSTSTPATTSASPALTNTRTSSASPGFTNTVTVTATVPTTKTVVTLSIETVTPSASSTGSPTVSTGFNTLIGCGTAHNGCGTVVGSGTVYLAPFGFPAVTSSGTVSGCAPTVIGCGTMIATTGTFTGTATITACGEGTGSATMIGSGTVWPAGFKDMISFVSSGTVTGSGRVKGCGTLIGSGTFTITEPYSATVTPSATPTVNVYISYCPPDPLNPLQRLAGNFSEGTSPTGDSGLPYRYAQDALLNGGLGNSTGGANGTTSNSSMAGNPLCHVCPQDSGICCPLYTDCGLDGHCPWTALEACGYARFGVNLVDVRNSSGLLGMQELAAGVRYGADDARYRAPGLPGSNGVGGSSGKNEKSKRSVGIYETRDVRKREAGLTLKERGNLLHDHISHHARGLRHGHGH